MKRIILLTVIIVMMFFALSACGNSEDNRDINHFIRAFTDAGYVLSDAALPADLFGRNVIDSATFWVGDGSVLGSRNMVSIMMHDNVESMMDIDEWQSAIDAEGIDGFVGSNGRFAIMTTSRTLLAFFEGID